MAALVIALGQARADPPLVNREVTTADKSEKPPTGPREEGGGRRQLFIFSLIFSTRPVLTRLTFHQRKTHG